MSGQIIDLTDDDGYDPMPVIDLTAADDEATPLSNKLSQSAQRDAAATRSSGNQLWRAGVETLHKVASSHQKIRRSRSYLSTAQSQGLLRAFGVTRKRSRSRAASPAGIKEPPDAQQRPLPSFADLLQIPTVAARSRPAPPSAAALRDAQLATPRLPHLSAVDIHPATPAPQFNLFDSFRNRRSRAAPSPSLPPVVAPEALRQATAALRSHGHLGIGADGLLLPNVPRVEQPGTEANPILIVDNSEEVTVYQRPASARSDTAQGELHLYSDGSVIGGSWGGCAVAYMRSGHWSGRAISLGACKDSGRAELYGIYQAYRLAAELLLPEHRRVTIYTDCAGLITTIGNAKQGRTDGNELLGNIVAEDRDLLRQGVEVQIRWVKGHSVSAGNQMADLLAGMASQQSSRGFGGQSWNNPNLGMLAIGMDAMRRLSNRAKVKGAGQLRRKRNKALPLENIERRAHKVESRRAREMVLTGNIGAAHHKLRSGRKY